MAVITAAAAAVYPAGVVGCTEMAAAPAAVVKVMQRSTTYLAVLLECTWLVPMLALPTLTMAHRRCNVALTWPWAG